MEMTANYNESQYAPFNNLAKYHDYRMAAFYNDQQTRTMYYEYTQNQMKLKSLNNSEPSLNGDFIQIPNATSPTMSAQPRLHAYDFQLYNDQKYLPNEEHVYDSLRRDYPNMYADWNHPEFCYENVSICSRSKKNRGGKNSTKSRSKSGDRTRRKLSRVDNSDFWEGNAQIMDAYGNVCSLPMNRSLSGNVYQARPYNGYQEECESYPTDVLNGNASQRGTFRSDSSHGRWQQWPWSSRGGYCMPLAFSPSSPLDSGLSSQSVASSPSFEAEPSHIQRFPECGSPVPLASYQRNQCSCSTTSFPDPNIHSPPVRSDSGRSSPWAHSAVSRLNTLTKAKRRDSLCDAPIFVDVVTSPDDFDNRRFSMSGIYISPRDKNYVHTSTKVPDFENENAKTLRKKSRPLEKASVDIYEYAEREEAIQALTVNPEVGTFRGKRSEQQQHAENDSIGRRSNSNICNKDSNDESYEKSPDPISSLSSPTSTNSTDSSTQTNSKNNSESPRPNKRSSKQSEKAICELEEMYNKLNLQDRDLLDRAERRDLPTVHQDPRLLNGIKIPGLTRSKSDSFFEILGPNLCNPFKKPPRAPPSRRSGVPDRIADDMAIRKLQKPTSKPVQSNENASTYMLYSSHFTPSLSVANDILLTNRPDVEYDDLSYRRYFHMSSGKMSEPHPPFGIPLKPSPPQSIFSDYLHVVPSGVPPPICHPRGNPDVVRDDLAFRALRKDDPERALYDSYSLFYRKMR